MVERVAFGARHWSDVITFGPFLPEPEDDDDGRAAAERFADSPYGGLVYDATQVG